MATTSAYPVRVTFDYPETLDRTTTLLRLFMWIPVAIMLALLAGGFSFTSDARRTVATTGGGLLLAIAATILFRGYIPHWIFNFQVALMQFQTRAYAYLALLTDRYPAFESEYPVNVEIDYPTQLTRWKVVIWKFITAIPHLIVLIFLSIAAVIVVIIAWFAILFTGRYPRGLFDFVAGVLRWGLRVEAYVYSLTDEYPPFSFD
jgi:uncharacterized protein DUF4389